MLHGKLLPLLLLLAGCGGTDSPAPTQTTPSPPPTGPAVNLAVPDNRIVAAPAILLFGNSHSGGSLPAVLQTLIATGKGPAQVVRAAGADYLDERQSDGISQALLSAQPWHYLVLQAQKYSTTGQYQYATSAAESWIAQAKQLGVTPVLFPEHPRAGNTEEGMRVYQLHRQIAAAQAACVAPIGPVWDAVQAQWPEIVLHSADGNHAAAAGVLLTSFILYEVITGNPADTLPDLPALATPVNEQRLLRQAASAGIRQYPACPF